MWPKSKLVLSKIIKAYFGHLKDIFFLSTIINKFHMQSQSTIEMTETSVKLYTYVYILQGTSDLIHLCQRAFFPSKIRLKTHQGATVLHWMACVFINMNKLQRAAILRFLFQKTIFIHSSHLQRPWWSFNSHKLLSDIVILGYLASMENLESDIS